MPAARKPAKDPAASYNKAKEFQGRRYTGMAVGRRHKWYYDQGEWKERKITPDRWEFEYAVTKRRAGRAPEGSGVPTGTEYDWFILARQAVRKLNANDYATAMEGFKYKIAHKRAEAAKWSVSEAARRKRLIRFLEERIAELKGEPEPLAEATGNAKRPPRKKTRPEGKDDPQERPKPGTPKTRAKAKG